MNQIDSIRLKQDNPFYKSSLLSQSRIQPSDRMNMLSRPVVRLGIQKRRPIGTVADIYRNFAQPRRTA